MQNFSTSFIMKLWGIKGELRMGVILNDSKFKLLEELIQDAEKKCDTFLPREIESYMTSLLDRYLNQPDLADRLFATAYLQTKQYQHRERTLSLQIVGDECLLYAGLFPLQAEKKHVKIDYFIKLGRTAYHNISSCATDLYGSLAAQFVLLTDILQIARNESDLLPLDAYERWQTTGSHRAYKMLLLYTKGQPFK